ncbi:MAG: OsmC family protein [Aureliella sp.]
MRILPIDAQELRSLQQPLKAKYRDDPNSALVKMTASGTIRLDALSCEIPSEGNTIVAGLHPAAGGSGEQACSGDMLLQSLVACSGVTFAAVATAMEIPVDAATVTATGTMDFRGTLGIDKQAPVGLTEIQLAFEIQSAAEDEALAKLVSLTERYCVVLQTLAGACELRSDWKRP